jgi:quinol monooxygenase YgiN
MTTNTKAIVYVVTDLWPLPDKIQEVKKILYDIVPEAKKEKTCLKYELCENMNDKTQLTLLQAWSTEQALEEHLQSEIINKATEELQKLLAKPTEIRRYKNIG